MSGPTAEQLVRWKVFRAQMKKRRLDLGLTRAELGRRMNRSAEVVAYLEINERSMPNINTAMDWADALNGTFGVDWEDPE